MNEQIFLEAIKYGGGAGVAFIIFKILALRKNEKNNSNDRNIVSILSQQTTLLSKLETTAASTLEVNRTTAKTLETLTQTMTIGLERQTGLKEKIDEIADRMRTL